MPRGPRRPAHGPKVIVAGARADASRRRVRLPPDTAIDPATDPFGPGNKEQTPPEVHRVGREPWQVRVVPNKYPALVPDAGRARARRPPRPLHCRARRRRARGDHQRAGRRSRTLARAAAEQVELAVDAWRERMRAHAEAACLHLIVNEHRDAGASLPHTHAQLYALGFVPAAVARERERFGAYAVRTMGGNLLADLVQEEVRRRERIVAIDGEAVLMAPYASRVPFHLVLAPRRAAGALRGRRADRRRAAARRAQAPAHAARRAPPLNLWVRTAPSGAEHFCWRIEIQPRLTHIAGLELGTGVNLNIVSPEQAAAELRDLRALVQRVAAPRSRSTASRRRDRPGAARPARRDPCRHRGRRRPAGRKVRALRIFATPTGKMNEALGDARGAVRLPVHALRRHAQGQPAGVRRRRAARGRRAALRAVLRAAGGPARRVRRPHGRRAGQRRAGHGDDRGPVRRAARRCRSAASPPSRRRAAACRRAETLQAEFLGACLRIDTEEATATSARPASSLCYPDRTWSGRTYVPVTSRIETRLRALRLRVLLAGRRGRAVDFYGWADFTDVTADDNPEWRMDLTEEVVGGWRGEQGKVAAMTLIWGAR